MVEDRQPPQDLELETVVLGSIISSGDALLDVIDILDEDCFYNPKFIVIFQSIVTLYNKNEKIDILTLTNELLKSKNLEKVGGAYEVSILQDRIGSSVNLRAHSLILKELSIKRNLIKLGAELHAKAYKPEVDALELLEETTSNIDKIGLKVASQPFTKMDQIVRDNMKEIELVSLSDSDLTGVPSGFTDLDHITCGWQKSDLIIIAARPGMGKTTLALNIVEYAAIEMNQKVAFFSLEMSEIQLGKKSMASRSGIDLKKLKTGDMDSGDWDTLNKSLPPLMDANIYVDDQAAISVFKMKTKLRRLKHDNPDLGLVVIDYLQLMNGKDKGSSGQNREQEISFISRNLKGMAKELNLPIIALSQLSRGVESRPDKIPQLSDLRESGAIEQDADMVMFIYRPEYYDILEDSEGNSLEGKALVMVKKNRNGELGDVKLQFDGAKSKFSNLEYYNPAF